MEDCNEYYYYYLKSPYTRLILYGKKREIFEKILNKFLQIFSKCSNSRDIQIGTLEKSGF